MAKSKKALLTEVQVADLLGVSTETLGRLIDTGEFPDAFPVTERTCFWFEKDVKCYLYLQSRIGKRVASKGGKPSEK